MEGTVWTLFFLSHLVLGNYFAEHSMVDAAQYPEYFVAAVFEHARLGNSSDDPAKVIQMNLDFYKRAAEVASSKGANIIVYPEYGLLMSLSRARMFQYLENVPDLKTAVWNPCLQAHEFKTKPVLYSLSCMARKYHIVVVANIGDKQPCNKGSNHCPDDGVFFYNTNVVFDQYGQLISKYWKEHPFFEDVMNVPDVIQNPVFETEFGTFASFVCFDAIFKHIADVGRSNVENILLPTMWMDNMPMLNSIQYWQAWALGNKVNFIVANAHIPHNGAMGSGLFSGSMGALKYTFNPDGQSKLVVSRIPRYGNQTKSFINPEASITVITHNGSKKYDEDNINFDTYLPEYCRYLPEDQKNVNREYACFTEDIGNFTLVRLTNTKGHLKACNNGMCCSLDYVKDDTNESFFLAIANKTFNSLNHYFWWEEKCLVFRCELHNGKDCQIFPMRSATMFQKLRLEANFTTSFIYPSVLNSGKRLTPYEQWDFGVKNLSDGSYTAILNYKSSKKSKAFLEAALYGRCYNKDPPFPK